MRGSAGGLGCYPVAGDDRCIAVESGLDSREAYTIVEGKLSRTPARVRRGVPTLGRDSQEILEELLGYVEARVAELAVAGVLE